MRVMPRVKEPTKGDTMSEEAYNQGYEHGAREFLKLSYQRRLKRQAVVGCVFISITGLAACIAILAFLPLAEWGTQ